jgi:hypothetical protein
MGERGKASGGEVVDRPATRVDGYSSPRAKKLVIQVSKAGLFGLKCKGSDCKDKKYLECGMQNSKFVMC